MSDWPSLRRPIEATKQLLVEGRTPEIFFREWIEALGLKSYVEVRDFRSIGDLTDFLKVFTSLKQFREGVTSLGIVRDAEQSSAASAFDSVCSSLKEVGLSCPDGIGKFSEATPRTGIFVLPDCSGRGMLETLCWSVLAGDPRNSQRLECVASYLTCLRSARVDVSNEAKMKVWAYLAGEGRFEPQLGRAAQAKMFDWAAPAFGPLSTFLKSI